MYQDYQRTDPPDTRVDPAFPEDGAWPRRLLHIGSLKSYPWRPGNIYNGISEPEYFAVTYTWGRWEIPADSNPSLAHLDFGTPWPIPRVEPARFTPLQFTHLLKSLPTLPQAPVRFRSDPWTDVKFVWIDVACIDQRVGSREKELEIGRQAAIFRGAKDVFAWLHEFENQDSDELYRKLRHGAEVLQSCISDLGKCTLEDKKLVEKALNTSGMDASKEEATMVATKIWLHAKGKAALPPKMSNGRSDPQLDSLQKRADALLTLVETSSIVWKTKKPPKLTDVEKIQKLVVDVKELSGLVEDFRHSAGLIATAVDGFTLEPWFSSLWTLQEAYLRPSAYLLDRNADFWVKVHPRIQLDNFIDLLHKVIACFVGSDIENTVLATEIRPRVEGLGCLELRSKLPTILLKASQQRIVHPTRVHDRVYGIMQVFGFKLGRATPDCPPDAEFTLGELEEQLGASLLRKSPILSQLFYHTHPAPPGKGWRMCATVGIPQLANRIDILLHGPWSKIEAGAKLSVETIGGVTVGHFSAI
ncbi:hypothetical protein EJ04DRAFT_595246 [Polyplosphaeria fusca]|uniref:Heterokaryon incompatibility domain-containing protein n=1 Tax=Polyplosphaeria fusca TaxID=682080 RepID=A0A9P4QKI4_9PLEO|nr:hypothetical protein EJ04DRAFT_595246 [Polyplosphaeria fusca]